MVAASLGAPKVGDKGAWGPRIAQGKDTLYNHAIHGFNGKTGVMPAKGGRADWPDDLIKQAVDPHRGAEQVRPHSFAAPQLQGFGEIAAEAITAGPFHFAGCADSMSAMVRATRNTRCTPRADSFEPDARLRQQQPAATIKPAQVFDFAAAQFGVELASAVPAAARAWRARAAPRRRWSMRRPPARARLTTLRSAPSGTSTRAGRCDRAAARRCGAR